MTTIETSNSRTYQRNPKNNFLKVKKKATIPDGSYTTTLSNLNFELGPTSREWKEMERNDGEWWEMEGKHNIF